MSIHETKRPQEHNDEGGGEILGTSEISVGEYNRVEHELARDDISDSDRVTLIREKSALQAELAQAGGVSETETQAGQKETFRKALGKIGSEATDDLGTLSKLQELFARLFSGRFEKIPHFKKILPRGICVSVTGSTAESLRLTLEFKGEAKHFIARANGKIDGGIPKSWGFSKADLLETLISAVDLYGDSFFDDTVGNSVDATEIGLDQFFLDGEAVPPDEIEKPEKGDGSSPIKEKPEDPRRLAFYKSLPGVLCSFKCEINTRSRSYGSQGIPYRVYVFPKHIILDCSEVGNAVFVRELDSPLEINMERLKLPASERMTLEEKKQFNEEIWGPTFSNKGKKALVGTLGFTRIYHPKQGHEDKRFYDEYFTKLAEYIDFSQYQNG